METIREVFSKPIDRRIEEVIKVDQADEETVLEELQEYVITESIGDHFTTVYKAIADAQSEPHEGIGIWVSGFFGSGKSSFAKIIGYTVGGRTVRGQSASQVVKDKAQQELSKPQANALVAYLDVINAKIPTHAIIFDVSMDRGVRTASERITEIMYKALLRELGYAEDFDLADLGISLEADGLLDTFREEFQALHSRPWEIRRKLGRGINEASAVLNKLDQTTYPNADSWAKSLGQGRADITPNLLAERAFELANRRQSDKTLIFIIDEVGQYVSRSVDKMLDLQAVVQAFGREGKNRVNRRQTAAPCWIVVTSQEKLHEVVDALDSRKIELARLQDRFPYPIDLKQSDISEVTSKRVLHKNSDGARILGEEWFDKHGERLKILCTLERTSRNTAITRENFIFERGTLYDTNSIDRITQIMTVRNFWADVQKICGEDAANIKRLVGDLISRRNQVAHRADRPGDGEEADGHGLRPINLSWTNVRVQAAKTLITAGAEVIQAAICRLEADLEAAREQEDARRLARQAAAMENRL